MEEYFVSLPEGQLAKIQRQSIRQAIDENLERARGIYDSLSYSIDFDRWKSGLESEIVQGAITVLSLDDEMYQFEMSGGRESYQIALKYAVICNGLAEGALDLGPEQRDGKLHDGERQAWAFVNFSSYCLGLTGFQVVQASAGGKSRHEIAKNASYGRWSTNSRIKNEIVRLLTVPRDGGWGERKQAADALKLQVEKFLEENGLENPLVDTQQRIYEWLGNNAEIKAAYASAREMSKKK